VWQRVVVFCNVVGIVVGVLQCVACCSVLQRVAACCSVLQRVAVCGSVLQCSRFCRGRVDLQPHARNLEKLLNALCHML